MSPLLCILRLYAVYKLSVSTANGKGVILLDLLHYDAASTVYYL